MNKINLVLICGGIFACVGFSYFLPGVYADSYKHIGIEFSDSCLMLIETGNYDTCSNPEFIKSMFPTTQLKPAYQVMFDNAEQTEQFNYQKNDIYLNHKSSCVQKNYCNVFNLSPGTKIIYWYDIDQKNREYFDAIITITPNILHDNLNDKSNPISDNGTNRTLSFKINRLDIHYCKKILYEPFVIWNELGRIIWYVVDGCTDKVKLSYLADPYVESLNKTEIDVSTSPKWINLRYWETIKENYTGLMIGKD